MGDKTKIKQPVRGNGLDKYKAKSARIINGSRQTTAPEHYGSGAVYISKSEKED